MSVQAKIPLAGLLEGYEVALSEMGYSISTKLQYVLRAELVIRKHQTNGLDYLDRTIIDDYVKEFDDRHFNGEIERMYCERKKLEIARFVQYAYSGNGGALPSVLRGARQKLTPEFERIADDFLSGDFHPNTRCDMRWVTHKYFSWLEEQGFRNLSGVGAVQIQKFLLECSEQYAPSSIHNILLFLKKLYAFLYESGQSESDYKELLSFHVNREKKVYPALPKADIAKLLDAIDRSTVKGKRDYAIMLMGTVLGLRACDIVKLKLAILTGFEARSASCNLKRQTLYSCP